MIKKWYQSRTIQSAIGSYVILLLTTFSPIVTSDAKLTEEDITALIAGTVALAGTIQGRTRVNERPPEGDRLQDVDSNEGEGDVTDVPFTVRVTRDTYLKPSTEQSESIPKDQLIELKRGASLGVVSYTVVPESLHLKVKTEKETGYLFVDHIELIDNYGKAVNLDRAKPVQPEPVKKTPIRLPGYKSLFYLEDSIIPDGHFTWSEATKNGSRIPTNKATVDNIMKAAKMMERVRSFFGDRPVVVTSWYRDPVTNARVGGATRSRHLSGLAVDFYVPGLDLEAHQNRFKDWALRQGYGVGLGAHKGFIHVDTGKPRYWNY